MSDICDILLILNYVWRDATAKIFNSTNQINYETTSVTGCNPFPWFLNISPCRLEVFQFDIILISNYLFPCPPFSVFTIDFFTWSPPKRISVVPHLTRHPPTLVAFMGLGQWVQANVAGSKASGLYSSTIKRTSSYKMPGLPNLLNCSQVLFVSNLDLFSNQEI